MDISPFTRMAEAITRNQESGFGGAFVIIPPKDGGDVIETLVLDAAQDPSQFWAILKTKCELQLDSLNQAAAMQAGFGRMR